jgi:hypothetical protein
LVVFVELLSELSISNVVEETVAVFDTVPAKTGEVERKTFRCRLISGACRRY